MPFAKGKSGNPTGKNGQKPISDAIRSLLSRKPSEGFKVKTCKTNAQLIALNLVAAAIGGNKDATKEVIDRVEGKPAQALEHSGQLTLTHEEILAHLADDDPA
jgi:hypothetical protein